MSFEGETKGNKNNTLK